jgi:hypothetical protein
MRISRAPERRGGTNKIVLYLALIFAAVVIGILVTYFATGFDSRSATGDQTGIPEVAANSTAGVGQLAPTPIPPATATPVPTVAMKLLEAEPQPLPRFVPDVQFGEVLSEGFVDINLPGNNAHQSWYTFQVDTATRDITLFFAVYDQSQGTIIRTVKIEGYTQGTDLEIAEVTLYYPQGPERVIVFDGNQGTITLTQQIRQPYGPSLFSPKLRVALVNQRMLLKDETGAISTELQLDLSGLSDSEVLVFQRTAPEIVDDVLSELQDLVRQVEGKRIK